MMNVEDLYRILRTSHVQAQGIVDTIPDPLLVLDESLRVQNASRSFFETFRVDRYETIGQQLFTLGNGQWDIPELRSLLQDVIPRSVAVVNFRVEHDFPSLGPRTMLLTARTLFHPDNAGHLLLLSIVDVTDQARRDVAKDMLFGELRHRMKNLLSVAHSMARLTPVEDRSAEEYREAFLGRFAALIAAQDIAFAEDSAGDLKTLTERVLAPFSGEGHGLVIEPGEPVELTPKSLTSLSLVFNELATNAAKYGALSAAGGRVSVSWRIEDGERLRITWAESGGPAVVSPDRKGYGSELIRTAISYTLHGQLGQEYASDGYRAEIAVPLVE
ncbi:HWE histidine kinase domain-containing protein [Hansschlegelia beijingensis]|uniref:Blue-light-activated histidine kinase n=1 Tax=Hansschlegelia beijingensis TaxID=1133344 RepID=A0A7W6D4F1_9HYPH|nr:HWE histidine kinase domain-containing protein [Hansschlegelia beijingensis]MBB3974411.1 two-component sensor histidine kinase [Hansschlegelia beijingensis]